MTNTAINKLVIIGVGLIGGSFAMALRQAGMVKHITGVGRSAENMQRAFDQGVIDETTTDMASALQNADVVLYDALVNVELLEYATNAEQIFVGKRKGCYVYQQEQINELIVQRAKSKGKVVRLKGGDPFIFGRGSEEMEYAASHGVDVAMVPGISSSVAVPAFQNIPVTKRGSSESFWVITGTTKNHKLSTDVALAAKSNATVVILMGMGKLAEIVALFKEEGKSDTPMALIQHAYAYTFTNIGAECWCFY